VPFYSVIPDGTRFPCYNGMDADPPMVEDDGPRSPSMSYARINDDLAEIVARRPDWSSGVGTTRPRWPITPAGCLPSTTATWHRRGVSMTCSGRTSLQWPGNQHRRAQRVRRDRVDDHDRRGRCRRAGDRASARLAFHGIPAA